MVRLYEFNEVHECKTCGLMIRVTLAAVPIEPVSCCGQIMEFLGIKETNEELDLTPMEPPEQALEQVYETGQTYWCNTCGLEVTVIRRAQPIEALDCCGEGMELLET